MFLFKEKFNNWFSLRSWRPYFIIFTLGFLLYAQTLSYDLTYLDDNTLLIDRYEIIKDIKNIPTVFSTDVFSSGANFFYRPFLNLSFMLDAQNGVDNFFIFHLDNIFLHIIAVFLLFIVLKKILKNKNLAFFLSLIFLFHPVLTQAVAWLPGRNDSLVTIFILASFLCLLSFSLRPRPISLLGYSIFFFIALLTKETAIFFPFLVLIYLLTIGRRDYIFKSDRMLLVVTSFAAMFIWYLMRSYVFSQENIGIFAAGLSVFNNISGAFILGAKMILPFNLSVLPVPADSSLLLSFFAWPLLFIALFLSREKRWDYIIFGSAWFLMFFIPPFAISSAAPFILEHRLYLPLIGFLIVISEIDWIKNLDFNKKNTRIICALILIILAALTLWHSAKFSNRLSFWKSAVSDSPHSPLAQKNMGAMYYLEGNSDLALINYNKTLELSPNEPMVHNNIGLIYQERGNYGQAEKEYKNELIMYPEYDKALYNLGNLYYSQRRYDLAIPLFRAALNSNPYYYAAYQRLLNLDKTLR
ncbi:MAG: tetratricopeptide repeat protein [Patescibacteria group bacterium]